MNYAREIKKYLKREILISPASGNEQNFFQYGFMQKRIPEEFITEDLKKSGKINLTLDGKGFLEFKKIIKNLRNDKLTEHLKD